MNAIIRRFVSTQTSATFKKLLVVKLSPNFTEATKVVDVSLVSPKDDEILVKNHYLGVNATDINITAGRYFTDGKVPFDIGLESLGVVESVGKDVTGVTAGQAGVCFGSTPKAFAEYVYVKRREFIRVPDVKPEFIALCVCGLTASIGLDKAGRVQKGDKVLITAAAGGTGHICVQWAKQKGAYVIGTTSSNEKAERLKELGVDRVINYKEESINEVLTKEFPEGIDVIWETIGGSVFETLFKHLAINGRMAVVGATTGYKSVGFPDVSLTNLPAKLIMKSSSLNGVFLMNYRQFYSEYLKTLIQQIHTKQLKIAVDFGQNTGEGVFQGIDSVTRGVEYLHCGRNFGKVVIKL